MAFERAEQLERVRAKDEDLGALDGRKVLSTMRKVADTARLDEQIVGVPYVVHEQIVHAQLVRESNEELVARRVERGT